MRDIKFRGQTETTKGKEWVYGYYYKVKSFFDNKEQGYMGAIRGNHLQDLVIDEDTLGQYTGLHDKNGKEIYEGDILEVKGFSYKGYNTGVIIRNVLVEFKDYHWSCGSKSLLNLSTWEEITLEVIRQHTRQS